MRLHWEKKSWLESRERNGGGKRESSEGLWGLLALRLLLGSMQPSWQRCLIWWQAMLLLLLL